MKPFEDFHSRVGSLSMEISIEKQRANGHNNEMPPEVLMEELRNNLKNNGLAVKEANEVSASKANLMATPGNSGMLVFMCVMICRVSVLPSEHMHACMML